MSKCNNNEYAFIGYYIDGQVLCCSISKKKVLKYLSVTRNLNNDDYFILKVSFDKVMIYDKYYLTTEYDRVYTNIDIAMIREMFYQSISDLADVYNTLKYSKKIYSSLLDTSYIDKTINTLEKIVSTKERYNDTFLDARYEFFTNNPIYKMDIYSYLNMRDSIGIELMSKYMSI